jgi:hypothetical protein
VSPVDQRKFHYTFLPLDSRNQESAEIPGFGHRRIWPPPIRRPMPVFSPVLGVCPTGFGGDQILEGSVEGGNAPPQ